MSSEARKGVSWYHINVSNGESLLSVTVVLDEIDPDGDAAYLFEASGELARRWNKRGAGRGPRGVQRARPRHLICRWFVLWNRFNSHERGLDIKDGTFTGLSEN